MTTPRNRLTRFLSLALGLALALFVVAVPAYAHANWLDVIIPLDAILDMTLGVFVGINTLLGDLLASVGKALSWILSLPITELTVVGVAWKIIRDICNLVFIVVFIGISFATIFNATGLFKTWHYRTALMPLIIAALLMNFSLAIGKTVALASNEAAKVVLSVMKDPGTMLTQSLKPNSIAIGVDMNARAALSAPIVDTRKTLTADEEVRYNNCLNELKTVVDTNENAFYYAIRYWTGRGVGDQQVLKTVGDCNLEINDARFGTTPEEVAATGQKIAAAASGEVTGGTTDEKFALIANEIFKAVMIIMLISCLLSAFLFLGFRVIVVWVLLAISPVAFASFAIPGTHAGWNSWKNHLIAWNVFGPLYLLTLIPGILMLGGSGEMMLRMKAAGGDIGTASMLIQQFFYYAFAVIIFIGGLKLSLDSSFAGAVKGTQIVGGWADKAGIFDRTGSAPLRTFGEKTGVTAAAKGVGGALADKYGKPFRGMGVDQERVEARFRQLATGDKSQMEALQRKQIEEQVKKNKESGRSNADLRDDLKAVGSPKYFAAAKSLLDAGELSPAEMSAYATAAAKVSPTFGRTVKESVDKKLKERSKDKQYKNAADVNAALNLYKPNPKDSPQVAAGKTKMRDDILKGLEKNQPLVASELVAQGMYPGKTAENIIEANFSALEHKDVRTVLDRARAGSLRRTPDMDRLIAGRSRKLADHLNLIADATPQQQAEIRAINAAAGIRPRP